MRPAAIALLIPPILLLLGSALALDMRAPSRLVVPPGETTQFDVEVINDWKTDAVVAMSSDAPSGIILNYQDKLYLRGGETAVVPFSLQVNSSAGVGVHVVRLRASSSGEQAGVILLIYSSPAGIEVNATSMDFDGDGYKEDVEVRVHERGNENAAVPNASIYIDDDYVGDTDKEGKLRANDFEEGKHRVRAEWGDLEDETEFYADEPPHLSVIVRVQVTNFTGSDFNDAVIFVNLSVDGDEFPLWHAEVYIDGTQDYMRNPRTDYFGRVFAYNLPKGYHQVVAKYGGMSGTRSFFSFGDLSPSYVIVEAETFANDGTFYNDVIISVRNATGPLPGVDVYVPGFAPIETDEVGKVVLYNLERGTYDVVVRHGGEVLGNVTFYSEGLGNYSLGMSATMIDRDGDGYRDDLLVKTFDLHGPVHSAKVYLDGVRVGRTNRTGMIIVNDLERGHHWIEVEHKPLQTFVNNTTVWSSGQPKVRFNATIQYSYFGPGELIGGQCIIERDMASDPLLADVHVYVLRDDVQMRSRHASVYLPEGSYALLLPFEIESPADPGSYNLSVLLEMGEQTVKRIISFFVCYTEVDVNLTMPYAIPYENVVVAIMTISNPHPGPAVIYSPDSFPFEIRLNGSVIFRTRMKGDIFIMNAGEVINATVTYPSDKYPLDSGIYDLRILISPFQSANMSFAVINLKTERTEIITVPWTGVIILASTALLFFGIMRFEVPRVALFTLLVPLYSRMKRDRVLDHFLRGQIYEYIRLNPGVNFSEILRHFRLNNGTLTYHLNVLEREKYVKSIRDGVYRRYYLMGTKVETDKLSNVKHKILKVIREYPGISQANIAKLIGESRRLVNYHIKALQRQHVIDVVKNGRSSQVYLMKDLDVD